jgi:MFS family permease
VELLSGSAWVVGLARALQSLGMFLSPIVGATIIEHRRRVLPVLFAVGGAMRVQLLGLALAGLFLFDRAALVAICLFLGLFGLLLGMQGVAFNFLVAKVVPVELRGRLMGLRTALSGVVAGGVGAIGGRLVDANTLGDGYAATFLIAFVLTAVGLSAMLFVREPDSPQVLERSRFGQRLRQLPAMLRGDRGFTFYFVARALGAVGRMSMPFYVIFAKTRFEIGGAQLGDLTLAFVLAQSVGNLAWGTFADRRGFRAVFVTALSLWMLSALLLLTTTSFAGLVLVMVGLGAGLGGFMLAGQNLVLEFGAREDLPMRIAVANSAAELLGGFGVLAGGILYVAVAPAAVFWTAIAFQLAAVLVVVLHVDEPRWRSR